MLLSQLGAGAAFTGPDVDVKGLTVDSRTVDTGFLFAALNGEKSDGRRFIADAKAHGACADA